MSKTRTESIDSPAVNLGAGGIDAPEVPVTGDTLITPGRQFRDTIYTSRTLVMPDGQTVPIARGRATAVDIKQFEYLNAHPDMELIEE
jgi:hypothetical protein